MNGTQQAEQLRRAGFSDDEIAQWAQGERERLTAAGFSDAEVGKWFGEPPEPNMEPVRKLVRGNLASDRAKAMSVAGITDGATRPVDSKPATSFDDALSAGLQMSVSGLLARGRAPDKALAADPTMAQRVAASIGQTVGDLPFMAAGAVLGGAGGVETGPGALATAGAGAFGLPSGLRATLMDAYENGSFKSFGDFWERASGIVWQEIKGEITGAATALSGGGAKAATMAAPAAVRALAPTAAEIATMTTVGKALDGQVPTAQDFLDAAVVVGGLKVAGGVPKMAAKLRSVYTETGAHPSDVAAAAQKDPTVVQDLAAENRPVPASLGAAVQPNAKVLPDGTVVAEGGGAGAGEPPAREAQAAAPEPGPEKAVLDRVSVGESARRPVDFEKLYADFKDELYPIKAITDELTGGKEQPVALDPYKLARLTRGISGKADQFINYAPFDFNTYENVGKPLRAIIDPVKGELDGLRAFAVAKRALELDGRDIPTGVPLEEARQVVQQGDAKFGPVFRELVGYQDHLAKYLADAGVLSQEGLAAMREANRDYVPFFRLMDEEKAGGAGRGLSVRSPVKAIKGSGRKIIDPLESIVKNTYLFTTLAERNAVGRSLVDLAEKSGNTDLVKKVAAPAKPIEVQAKELQDFLDAHGIEADADSFSIFRRGYLNPADDQIVVFRDGKREVYQVPRNVAAAFKATDRETAGLLAKILAIPAKTLRTGATLTPDFFLRNFNRDQLSAAIYSDSGYLPVIDFMRGLWSYANRDADFQAWLKSGGANATMLSMDRRYLQAKVNEIAEIQSVREKAWNAITLPVELLRATSEAIENATRLGEFKRATGGDLSKASAQAAGYGSREVTLDFARIGAKTRALNMITAFFNAQIEGLDRTARAFKDAPFATALKVGGYVTLPSILLWWANHDDPRWKEIPEWERDLFWIVMTKDHIFRIPKPFELGVLFGSVPERLLDKFVDEKPEAMHDLTKSFMNVFGFNVIPTAALPLVEQATNHSFFTDRPLIPSGLEGLLPEYQYTPYTTEATKAIGHMIGSMPGMRTNSTASPMVIDNYVRGWTGSMGVYAVQIADAALRKAGVLPDPVLPAKDLADIPVIKAFMIRYPSAQAQSIQDFYDHYTSAKQITDTIQYLARQGDPEAAMRVMQIDPAEMLRLDGIHSALGNAHRMIQLVYKNPAIPAEEKRQIIDTAYMQMIEMARSGETALRQMKAALREAQETARTRATPQEAVQ